MAEPVLVNGMTGQEEAEICLPDYNPVTITVENLLWAWKHVELLKREERIFSAVHLIKKIEAYCADPNHTSPLVEQIQQEMQSKQEWIHSMKSISEKGETALTDFNAEGTQIDWIFGQEYFGVTTHWKPGSDSTVWLKLEGLIEGVDIFNTVAVLNEIDLYSRWVPFCNQSVLLHRHGHVDVHAYVALNIPLLHRDAIIHAVGINACYEHRCVLLLGHSVDETQVPSPSIVPLPSKLKKWGSDRLDMRAFRVLIEPITRTKTRVCLVSNMDLKCPLPKSLVNVGIKICAGLLIYLLRRQAESIEQASQVGTSMIM